MELKDISEKDYKNFIKEQKPISFLHNYEWGEVEKKLGKEFFRFGIYKSQTLIAVVQIIGHKSKRGNFLTISHGPIINPNFKENFLEIIDLIIEKIKKLNLKKKYSFLRVNFLFENSEEILKNLIVRKFKLAPRWFVSENFWIKEIDKTEEDLLKEMDNNHRKQILDSLTKPYLEIEKSDKIETIKIFWDLYKNLAKEKNFIPYSYNLIKNEFEIFTKEDKALWYLGKIENKYYSAALIIFDNNFAYYHHSASIKIKEPLNYKLQWQIILDARQRGCKFYNMWGITNQGKEHPWYGLTQFKKGFGGKMINFLPTLDFRLNWKYYLTYAYEKIYKKIKN
ncbi:MAG: peptidoglycan bridge formation protein FemAB [Candidatus Parcubacteria bacterium]|nr:MAG: peptidoglycan bridge formation protein FemAB [Candidatus Parcubacteria bacterium]